MKPSQRSRSHRKRTKKSELDELYVVQAEFCKGLAHPKRILILNLLKHEELSVSDLVNMTGIPQSNLSQHLAFLRQQGLLTARRSGMNIYYSVKDKRIIEACDLIREIITEKIKRTQSLLK